MIIMHLFISNFLGVVEYLMMYDVRGFLAICLLPLIYHCLPGLDGSLPRDWVLPIVIGIEVENGLVVGGFFVFSL
jgi:hypothetical protein